MEGSQTGIVSLHLIHSENKQRNVIKEVFLFSTYSVFHNIFGLLVLYTIYKEVGKAVRRV